MYVRPEEYYSKDSLLAKMAHAVLWMDWLHDHANAAMVSDRKRISIISSYDSASPSLIIT